MVNSEWVTSKIMGLVSELKTHVHDASKITSGTIDAARLPEMSASKITSGVFDVARLPEMSASKITSGVFDVARIPPVALERLVVVADDTARYALTIDNVQNGDTVKVIDTGYMYFVSDDTHLDSDLGYTRYTAGGIDAGQIVSGVIDAARIPWVTLPWVTYPLSVSTTNTRSVLTISPARSIVDVSSSVNWEVTSPYDTYDLKFSLSSFSAIAVKLGEGVYNPGSPDNLVVSLYGGTYAGCYSSATLTGNYADSSTIVLSEWCDQYITKTLTFPLAGLVSITGTFTRNGASGGSNPPNLTMPAYYQVLG